MPVSDSKTTVLDAEALAYARGLLKAPLERDGTWGAIGAMALLAVMALSLAFVVLTGPAPGVERAPIGDPVAPKR